MSQSSPQAQQTESSTQNGSNLDTHQSGESGGPTQPNSKPGNPIEETQTGRTGHSQGTTNTPPAGQGGG